MEIMDSTRCKQNVNNDVIWNPPITSCLFWYHLNFKPRWQSAWFTYSGHGVIHAPVTHNRENHPSWGVPSPNASPWTGLVVSKPHDLPISWGQIHIPRRSVISRRNLLCKFVRKSPKAAKINIEQFKTDFKKANDNTVFSVNQSRLFRHTQLNSQRHVRACVCVCVRACVRACVGGVGWGGVGVRAS